MNKRWFVVILTIGLLLCLMPVSALALDSDPIMDSDGNIIGWEDLSTDIWSFEEQTVDDVDTGRDVVVTPVEPDTTPKAASADSSETENTSAEPKPFVADLYADDPIPDLYAEPADSTADSAVDADTPAAQAVCKIDGVGYETLTEAISAAQPGDQIDLAQDITLETGLTFSGKDLTVSGGGIYKLTLNTLGIHAANSTITFANMELEITASDNPSHSGATANLISDSDLTLDNVSSFTLVSDGLHSASGIYLYRDSNLYMNGTTADIRDFNGTRASGIYADNSEFDGQPNRDIKLTGSTLTISGCDWHGMTINPIDVTLTGSNVTLTGNGSATYGGGLGCYYGKLTMIGSTLTADDNPGNSWGVFVKELDMDGASTLSACGNTGMGMDIGGTGLIQNGAKVQLDGNARDGLRVYVGSSYWYGDVTIESGAEVSVCDNDGYGISNGYKLHILPGANVTADRNAAGGIHNGYSASYAADAVLTVDSGANLTVEENTGSGIRNKAAATLELAAGSVRYNHSPSVGGGLWNEGTATLTDDVALYNNHALEAADDLYNADAAALTFGATGTDWALDGAPDCEDDIDGWYDDSADARWNAHAEDEADLHLVLTEPAAVTSLLTLKAAHGIHPTGSLVISKSITGKLKDEDYDTAFAFSIELEDDTVTTTDRKTYGDVVFENGKASFSLKDGESVTIENLPAGVGYTVTELSQDGWKLAETHGDTTGIVPEDDTAEIAFVNEKVLITGKLTISKSITGRLKDEDHDTAFQFVLALDDDTITTADAEEYGVVFEDGKASFSLKDGESITITNLPAGVGYTVTELSQDGWKLAETHGDTTGIVPEDDTAEIAFVNEKVLITGKLTISKSIAGDLDVDDYDTAFRFVLTLDDDTITTADATEYGVVFENGKASFSLKDGESITIANLPAGVGYTVTEIGQKGWALHSVTENYTGVVPEDDTAEIAFLNMKDDTLDPIDPVFPIDPILPIDPVDPVSPAEPDEPVLPEEPVTPPVQDATPDESEAPVLPEEPVNPPVQDATPDEADTTVLPQTGVVSGLAGFALLVSGAAMLAGGMWLSFKRRRSSQK